MVGGGDDERLGVAGRVGGNEVRIGEEGAPRPADGAEAAEVLGRDAQQDLAQHVGGQGQDAAVRVRPGAPVWGRHRRISQARWLSSRVE